MDANNQDISETQSEHSTSSAREVSYSALDLDEPVLLERSQDEKPSSESNQESCDLLML